MKTLSGDGETTLINEMQMYYEVRGQGEPLILLHGFTGSGANWELIFKEPPDGYRMIIPDLRGHGRSTNPSKTFTHRQSALDVFALLDRLNIERFQAIGVSCGAKTLLHMATQQPDRVEAMVLVSAAHYFPEQARAIMGRMTADNRTEEEWRFMRQQHKHGDEQIRALWSQGAAFKDSYDDMNFTPPLYPINIPIEIHQAINQSYLWIIPNGGHAPVFGEMAERFAETSLAFLRGEWRQAG